VVTFDSRAPGTPAGTWSSDARLAGLESVTLDGVSRLVVVAAHPDDETLGAGGLIARAAASGVRVHVVVVTDGGASHSDVPSAELAATRAAELRIAIGALGPSATISILDFADGGTREWTEQIRARLEPLLADADLIVAPWRGDGHRDHRVVGELCADIADEQGTPLLEYPVWMWHWATPDSAEVPWDRLRSIALSPDERAAKARAIDGYVSQTDGDDPILRTGFLENFAGDREIYVGSLPGGLEGSYFDDLYARRDDPWGFASRWYEKRKRALTMGALPREHYSSALEIGCSIGLLTELLAERVDSLLSVDVAQAALDRAAERLVSRDNVRFERVDVGQGFPPGGFDLIVLSEVGYYFDAPTLERVLERLDGALATDGTLLACHWRHEVEDYPLSGGRVHAALERLPGLTRVVRHEEEDFLLEVFTRDGLSVARSTGLL
jgi:LmbE family N-acetylglucosaminyl deacetylase/SAM-dependent methyltransferase